MESDGALALFRRSIQKYNLIYKTYVGDGDSKSYSTVSKACPYGPSVFIEKEECTSHITKRLGTGLREIVRSCKGKKLADGKGIGGQGRLTIKRIDTLQNFYGFAIRSNKGNAKAMAKATQAILKHYSSTTDEPKHDDCPAGDTSWCSYQRDQATGKSTHKEIKNPLPKAVVEKIQTLFDRLGNENFLAACERCKTQNVNEAYHNVVWSLAPKSQYNSPYETKLAVYLATLTFNQGSHETFRSVCTALDLDVSNNMKNQWRLLDNVRFRHKTRKSSEKFKSRRRVLKKERSKKLDAFVRKEGIQYKSGEFSGSKKKSSNN